LPALMSLQQGKQESKAALRQAHAYIASNLQPPHCQHTMHEQGRSHSCTHSFCCTNCTAAHVA
jgi:hypothetical protein